VWSQDTSRLSDRRAPISIDCVINITNKDAGTERQHLRHADVKKNLAAETTPGLRRFEPAWLSSDFDIPHVVEEQLYGLLSVRLRTVISTDRKRASAAGVATMVNPAAAPLILHDDAGTRATKGPRTLRKSN